MRVRARETGAGWYGLRAHLVAYHPSWNTDQGVYQMCKCDGDKPEREMKVKPVNIPLHGAECATGLGPDLL